MGLCQDTVNAVFVLRIFGEYSEPKISFFYIFVDLEKAFDWVPREVIPFVFRQKGVPEYLVNGVVFL